jgi:UDP-glucose 4-epimerase
MVDLVLVLGGAGFIGSHTVDNLIKRGYEVVAMDDLSTGKHDYVNEKCQFAEGNILNKDDLKKIINNYDPKIIMNFAVKCLLDSITNPTEVHKTNVDGVINILEAIRNYNKDTRFVHISSSEAYGSALQVPQQENHPMNPTTPYGASKAAADVYVKSYHICYEIPTIIVRPFNCYGPRMRVDKYCAVIYAYFKRIKEGKDPIVFGDGKQTRDFTFVTDTSNGIVDAMLCDVLIGHIVHVASGIEISILEIARICNELLDREPDKIQFDPPRQGDVRRHLADISRAKRLFNYEPKINIREGIKRTFEWLKENY